MEPFLNIYIQQVYFKDVNRSFAANPEILTVIGPSSCRSNRRRESPDLGSTQAVETVKSIGKDIDIPESAAIPAQTLRDKG